MIEAEASLDIRRPAAVLFACVCDVSRAPEWLQGCVALSLASPEGWGHGALLHYVHQQGGHEVRMTGRVTAWAPGRELRMEFADEMFGVAVALRFDALPDGTRVSHVVSIDLKSFTLRLMAPMIRVANQQQVAGNLERLKRLVESAD